MSNICSYVIEQQWVATSYRCLPLIIPRARFTSKLLWYCNERILVSPATGVSETFFISTVIYGRYSSNEGDSLRISFIWQSTRCLMINFHVSLCHSRQACKSKKFRHYLAQWGGVLNCIIFLHSPPPWHQVSRAKLCGPVLGKGSINCRM